MGGAQNVVSVQSPSNIPNVQNSGLQALAGMGIHQVNLGGVLGKMDSFIALVYQDVTSFALTYGGMFLVIAGLVWMIAWKFHAMTAAIWAKRVVAGVFISETIVVLLPRVYFSFLAFLSHF